MEKKEIKASIMIKGTRNSELIANKYPDLTGLDIESSSDPVALARLDHVVEIDTNDFAKKNPGKTHNAYAREEILKWVKTRQDNLVNGIVRGLDICESISLNIEFNHRETSSSS